jgi:hypothetical protein
MPFRFSRPRPADLWKDSPAAALDYEIAQEKAATLGRLGRQLEEALAALRAFDAEPPAGDRRAARGVLVAEAGMVLWQFIVQREALGMRDVRQVLRAYQVPGEVYLRMGAFPAQSSAPEGK